MSSVAELAQDLLSKTSKPAYVEFSQVAKQLHKQSELAGHYVAVDVDMVTVRQIGSADSSIFEVDRWLKQNRVDALAGRLPNDHAKYYEQAYRAWKSGQELPLEGTPIKGWAVISPAQAETIVRAGVRTVEDLSTANAEACTRIGMGGIRFKQMAAAWIAQAHEKGPLTLQMTSLQSENALLKAQLQSLTETVEAMQAQNPARPAEPDVLTEEDMLDAITPVKRSHKKKEA